MRQLPVVLFFAASLMAGGRPAAAQSQFFSVSAPPPVAAPSDAVDPGPSVRVSTPYMILDGGTNPRINAWFAKANASGSMTITLQVGHDDQGGPGGGTITATIVANGQQIGSPFSVTQPAFAETSVSRTIPTTAGVTYRITLSGPGGGPGIPQPPFVLYRLKLDGAEEAEFANGPSSVAPPQSDPDGSRWVMNVAAGEALSFSVLGGGPCQTPPICPVIGTQVTVFDPNHQLQLPLTAIPTTGGTITIPSAGNTPGAWVVAVVQPSHDPGSHSNYRLVKLSGIDPGIYAAWFTDGKGSIDVYVSAPPAVPAVDVKITNYLSTGLGTEPPPETLPTNQTIHFDGDVYQTEATITPPAGWTAVPSHVYVPITSDATTRVTIRILDTTAPVLTLPADLVAEATGPSGAAVTYGASATDFIDGPVEANCAPASGSTFELGTTIVHCSAGDRAGNTTIGTFTVTVRDTTPPAIVTVTPSTGSLWPPNHKMVGVSFAVNVHDLVTPAPACSIVSVSSSEPGNGQGDGNTAADWMITGALSVDLRAERSGGGDGRAYTVTVRCVDVSGNAVTATAVVNVPHDQGK